MLNVMMDPAPLFSEIPHPGVPCMCYNFQHKVKRYTRTSHPTKYYFIDFGISMQFESYRRRELVIGDIAQDQTVPELSRNVPYDPFAVDIYTLGNIYKEEVIKVC